MMGLSIYTDGASRAALTPLIKMPPQLILFLERSKQELF